MVAISLTRAITRTNKFAKRTWRKMTRPALVSAQSMPDEVFLAKFDIEAVRVPLQKGDITTAKEALLAHYERRIDAAWAPFPAVISDLELAVSDLDPAELITRAEAILENRPFFGLHREPQTTPAGGIDWQTDPEPGDSTEWLWLLNRQSWWSVLALAYAQTGDERYAAAFVSQLLTWIEANPMPPQQDERHPAWRLMETALRMRISWIPALALFYKSPAFTPAAKLAMLRSIYDHGQFLFAFKTNRNHLLRESNGLAYASTYFPEFEEAGLWQQAALERLEAELKEQVNPDGSHIEMSTGYQWLVIDEFQTTFDLLQAHQLALPGENLGAWLEKMIRLIAYVVRPDGVFPQLNDGFLFWDYTRLAEAGATFDRADWTYIGTSGAQGICPAQTSLGFDDAGLVVMRSDWSKEARYLLFDAGPYGGPHGHEDKLSFELYAFGQPFIVDPGTYTYDRSDPFRLYFTGSQGHNTVLVDGLSQIRRWQKAEAHYRSAADDVITWLSRPEFDYVAATYDEGYSVFSFDQPARATIINDVTHTRQVLFVKPDYWIMVDYLQSASPHTYQLLFHTAPEVEVQAGVNDKVVLSAPAGGAKLYLVPIEPEAVKVSQLSGGEDPIQGWYSARNLEKTPASTIRFEHETAASTIIATLLYPCPAGQTAGTVTIEPLPVTGGQGLGFVVTTGRGKDYLMLSSSRGRKQFGPYRSGELVAGVRTDQTGQVVGRFNIMDEG